MRKKILAALATLLAVAVLLAALKLPKTWRVANGYAAKWVCSNVFVGGRTEAEAAQDLPPNPLSAWLDVELDHQAGRATASSGGYFTRLAVYRPGLGCTLVPPGQDAEDLTPVRLATGEPPVADTWPWAGEDTAVDREKLDAAVATAFHEEDPARPKNTRAVVVVHDGSLVAERYAPGFSASSRLPGWSMTKSVLSALVGRAVALGHLDIGQSPEVDEWPPGDARRAITWDQLLRMSSGLDFEEDYDDLGSDAVRMLFLAGDTGAAGARSELAHPPDTAWYYSSGTSNLLSRTLRRQLGEEVYGPFPGRQLFAPLGMTSALIEPDAAGTYVASSFGWATARDWARFGLLYLGDGVWNGERLLPEGWVDYSKSPTPDSGGIYGAHFWLNADPQDGGDRRWPQVPKDTYLASGFNGQHVVIVPSRRCVLVRLGLSQDDGAWRPADFIAEVLAALPPT